MPGSAVEVPSRGRRPRRCSRGSGGAPARGVHLPPAAGRFSCWDRLREGRRRGAEGGARGPPALPVSAFPSRPCCQLPAQKPNQNQLSFLHFAVCVCVFWVLVAGGVLNPGGPALGVFASGGCFHREIVGESSLSVLPASVHLAASRFCSDGLRTDRRGQGQGPCGAGRRGEERRF